MSLFIRDSEIISGICSLILLCLKSVKPGFGLNLWSWCPNGTAVIVFQSYIIYEADNDKWHSCTNLDGFISVHDDGDKDTEYNVDKEADEDIEVDATVPPGIRVLFADCLKCVVHVVTIDEGEETLARRTEVAELKPRQILAMILMNRLLHRGLRKRAIKVVEHLSSGYCDSSILQYDPYHVLNLQMSALFYFILPPPDNGLIKMIVWTCQQQMIHA